MTAGTPVLTGYRHSVYTRAALIALVEKGVTYRYAEHDPFEPGAVGPHPFGRVPALIHEGFALYETAAITDYIDRAFDGPSLMPETPQAAARVTQVIGIVDAYAYWPLVRQVYSHAVFMPAMGEVASTETLGAGLRAAPRVLAALETIAAERLALAGRVTRADCHLAPMIAAFAMTPEGAEILTGFPALSSWWKSIRNRDSLRATAVPLPAARSEQPQAGPVP